jgi:uncharacterized membrane protein
VRSLLRFLKTLIVGGLLFLFPLVFVTFVVGKAFALIFRVTKPIVDRVVPTHTAADVALVDGVAIVALLSGCLVAGLVAQSRLGRSLYAAFDANLASLIPGYAILKARLGDAIGDAARKDLKTVAVRLDDYTQIALEMERLADGRVVVFLPGAPDPWSGASVIVDAARVTPLEVDVFSVARLMKDLGHGTSAVLKPARLGSGLS